MPTLKSNTPSTSRHWLQVPSLLPNKPWTPQPSDSNAQEPTVPSIPFYSTKAFGMSGTTKQWSMCATTYIANSKRGADLNHQTSRMLTRLPTSATSWPGSTTFPCATCTASRSPKMEEMTTGTTSEVVVFTP